MLTHELLNGLQIMYTARSMISSSGYLSKEKIALCIPSNFIHEVTVLVLHQRSNKRNAIFRSDVLQPGGQSNTMIPVSLKVVPSAQGSRFTQGLGEVNVG
ncbi:hypothetical protein PS2_020090 [Malus domestica]